MIWVFLRTGGWVLFLFFSFHFSLLSFFFLFLPFPSFVFLIPSFFFLPFLYFWSPFFILSFLLFPFLFICLFFFVCLFVLGFSFLFHKGVFAAALLSPRKPCATTFRVEGLSLPHVLPQRRCPGVRGFPTAALFLLTIPHPRRSPAVLTAPQKLGIWRKLAQSNRWDVSREGEVQIPPRQGRAANAVPRDAPVSCPSPGQRPCVTFISCKELKSLSLHPLSPGWDPVSPPEPVEGGAAEPRAPQRVPVKGV